MTFSIDRFFSTRRLILKGAGCVALVGLDNLVPVPALAAANDLEFRYGINAPTLRIEGLTLGGR